MHMLPPQRPLWAIYCYSATASWPAGKLDTSSGLFAYWDFSNPHSSSVMILFAYLFFL